jgi:hypothetical protein
VVVPLLEAMVIRGAIVWFDGTARVGIARWCCYQKSQIWQVWWFSEIGSWQYCDLVDFADFVAESIL